MADSAPAYRTRVIGLAGREIQLATSTRILCDATLAELFDEPPDTLLIAGGTPAPQLAEDHDVVATLRELLPQVSRVGSVCSGAFLLAATGCLNRRRATTHWERYELFRERFPQVELVIDALHTEDGRSIAVLPVSVPEWIWPCSWWMLILGAGWPWRRPGRW
ncbi:MAG: DJ-1/PfpI family protein [Thiolinea sp.]